MWNTGRTDFFLDGGFLPSCIIYMLLMVVVPAMHMLLSAGERFIPGVEGISRYRTLGRVRTIRRDELKAVPTYKPAGEAVFVGSGTILTDGKSTFMLSRHMSNVEAFYKQAPVRLPKSFWNGEAAQFFERELRGPG